MVNRILIALMVLVMILAATTPSSGSPASAVGRTDLLPQLGLISLCKTTIADVAARLGPGTHVETHFPENEIKRGWYSPRERVYLIVTEMTLAWARDPYRNLKGTPPIFEATLGTGNQAELDQLKVGKFNPPRLSLSSLRGPKGIKLGDTKSQTFQILGAGQLVGQRGDVETYNYYDIYPKPRRAGCAPGGIILRVTFTAGRLTRIAIIEAS